MTTATGALEAELRRRVQGEVRFDAYSKAMYSTDASIYRMEPVGVVIPRNADDAAAIVEICHRSGTAALPRGGGTGLAGQTVNHAVVMDELKDGNEATEMAIKAHCAETLGQDMRGEG